VKKRVNLFIIGLFYSLLLAISACQTDSTIIHNDPLFDHNKSDQSHLMSCPQNPDESLNDADYLFYMNKIIDDMIHSQEIKSKALLSRIRIVIAHLNYQYDMLDSTDNLLNQTLNNRILRSGRFIITNAQKADFQLHGVFSKIINKEQNCLVQLDLKIKNKSSNTLLWRKKIHLIQFSN
jgi:hypothetical protein